MQALQKMLKRDLILQMMKRAENYLKNQAKLIRLIKDELGGKIMIAVAALRPKSYVYLTNDSNENKKANDTKKVCRKNNT